MTLPLEVEKWAERLAALEREGPAFDILTDLAAYLAGRLDRQPADLRTDLDQLERFLALSPGETSDLGEVALQTSQAMVEGMILGLRHFLDRPPSAAEVSQAGPEAIKNRIQQAYDLAVAYEGSHDAEKLADARETFGRAAALILAGAPVPPFLSMSIPDQETPRVRAWVSGLSMVQRARSG